jgi:23S rRNA (guanosine2251-2'-O)-methyltransferase
MRHAEPAPLPPGPAGFPRLVLGLQPVRALIRAHAGRVGELWLEANDNPRLQALERFAKDQGISKVQVLGRPTLDRLAGSVLHQGAAAWARDLVLSDAADVLNDPALLGVVLDRVQDPQNFGAVLRSAVGLGAGTVLWGEHSSAPLGPATLRAAAGAAEFARLCRVASLPKTLASAVESGVTVVGLDASSDQPLSAVDLRGPTLLVIGSEQSGMTPAVRRGCSALARLVAPGPIESLNASVAAAIALYEAMRQRAISVS